MNKRILCLVIAALLVLSLMPALPSQAASDLKTCEASIEIIKSLEGFYEYPYFDYYHYSVGYGTTCQEGDYPNGITEEEADALLRADLEEVEADVNQFAASNHIVFSQYQFDALVLFTYNCGSGWMFADGEFRQAVLDNTDGNDFIYAITLWSTAGGQLSTGLLNRRLIEANMYLNGIYEDERPDRYTYVIYDNNGGEAESRAQGYDSNLTAPVRSIPTREGYAFLGWYTAAEGGACVRMLTAANSGQTLYAHWQAPGTVGTPASYQVDTWALDALEMYDLPGGNVVGTLNQENSISVEADYVDANGIKWARMTDGHWVRIGTPYVGTDDSAANDGVSVKVTGDYVNVRTGPGTGYGIVGGVYQDTVISLTRVVSVDGTLWGKFRAGWLCLDYTDYSGGLNVEAPGDIPYIPGTPVVTPPTEPETEPTEPETKPEGEPEAGKDIFATVISRSNLNVRSGAGTGYGVVGTYTSGQRIQILEQTTVHGVAWGRTDLGWVCMQYVSLDETWTNESGVSGVVTSNANLNIRSGAGVGYAPVGSYGPGTKIQIYELKTVNGQKWGRTDLGWVCMDYVSLEDTGTKEEAPEPTVPETQEPPKEPVTQTGTVTATGLNIRKTPGVSGERAGLYWRGNRVTILEQKQVNGSAWGRTDKGWISLNYVQLDAPGAENQTAVTGTVTASALRIRKGPGTGNAVVGSYMKGEKVKILETARMGATIWGRTDLGWICMDYVK